MKPDEANRLTASVLKSVFFLLLISSWAGLLFAQSRPTDPGLTAHEWGTFTSISGSDGQAMEWLPLGLDDLTFDQNSSFAGHFRSKDLPSFVEHLHWGLFKQGLRATVRMETPVLYFYGSHDATVSVSVAFSKGLITEWYPHAAAPLTDGGLDDVALYEKHASQGSVSWGSVALEPGTATVLPRDSANNNNRYYAARETSATPLRVNAPNGVQYEKFLFYRGVSFTSVPVSAKFTPEGNLLVSNSLEEGIPNIIWFERRGGRVGYRKGDALQDQALLDPPELTATVEHLKGDLEEMLVARGLYREEAHAMVETWRDSWFEEGSRLFYIVPARFWTRCCLSPSRRLRGKLCASL